MLAASRASCCFIPSVTFGCQQVARAAKGGFSCKKMSCAAKMYVMGRGAQISCPDACGRRATPTKFSIRGDSNLINMMHHSTPIPILAGGVGLPLADTLACRAVVVAAPFSLHSFMKVCNPTPTLACNSPGFLAAVVQPSCLICIAFVSSPRHPTYDSISTSFWCALVLR